MVNPAYDLTREAFTESTLWTVDSTGNTKFDPLAVDCVLIPIAISEPSAFSCALLSSSKIEVINHRIYLFQSTSHRTSIHDEDRNPCRSVMSASLRAVRHLRSHRQMILATLKPMVELIIPSSPQDIRTTALWHTELSARHIFRFS